MKELCVNYRGAPSIGTYLWTYSFQILHCCTRIVRVCVCVCVCFVCMCVCVGLCGHDVVRSSCRIEEVSVLC